MNARPPRQFAALLLLPLALAGCGVKTLYNNLDRLMYWSLSDLVELDAAQERFLRGELDAFLYWHRTTQLPAYARGIERIDRAVAAGLTVEDIDALNEMFKGWADAVVTELVPIGAQMLYSLRDDQLDQLLVGFAKNDEKYVKPFRDLDDEARRKRWVHDFSDGLENFVGGLTADQTALIGQYSGRYRNEEAAWLDYRRRWEQDLVALVRERRGYEAFVLAFRDMATHRERWYGDDYRRLFASNEALYRDVTVAVLATLNAQQRAALSAKLQSFARDFDELAAEAPPTAPPASCLVAC